MPVLIISPSGITNVKTTSTIAKQRSARLQRFQSEIQSCMRERPPVTPAGSSISGQHVKSSTEVWLDDDKEIVILPK
jgi:hypothetical protein